MKNDEEIDMSKRGLTEDQEYIFMQDSVPCHEARIVSALVTEKNVAVLPWMGEFIRHEPPREHKEPPKQALAKDVITTKIPQTA